MLPVGYFNGNQTPIGPDNKNGFGLYDMGGNASEWCWDREFTNWFSGYAEARDDNSKGPNLGQGASRAWAGSFYVGSTYFSDQFYELTTTARNPTTSPNGSATMVYSSIGLRCLRAK
jgi:formylglycine-generating enzyme required for sulfatase activity